MSDGAGPDRDSQADLAADYVLGVLGGAERRAAERRIARDPLFAREVADWERRLGPLARAVPEMLPPSDLWARVEADLARITRTPMPARPVPAPVPARPRGRRVSAIWQYVGIGGLGLAAMSGAALVLVAADAGGLLGPPPAAPAAAMTATLAGEGGLPLFTVVVDEGSGMATLVPVTLPASDAAHVHELWLVPAGGGAPRSLGLLDRAGPIRLAVARDGMPALDASLAVSLEPAGGSPTGRPTGPVVAAGPLRAI